MPDRRPTLLIRILLCALVFSALPVRAQQESQYRVELLVFSNPAGGAAEQWDATPELAYPHATRFLNPAEAPTAATSPAADSAATSPSSSAFVLLPASQRELGANAAALQRSGRYRILFHEAWTQPITGQAAAVPIALDRSGDGGPWPALQGTVKIYQAGAFFVDTNVWLNTSGEYLPGTWRMPAPPRAPASRAIEPPTSMDSSLPLGSPLQATTVPSTTGVQPTGTGAAEYPYRHAVLLKQSRKMRTGQLNYIDHPLLGVLVKITPLTAAEPELAAPDST